MIDFEKLCNLLNSSKHNDFMLAIYLKGEFFCTYSDVDNLELQVIANKYHIHSRNQILGSIIIPLNSTVSYFDGLYPSISINLEV